MLAASRIPEILQTIINDGADGIVLMTQDGSLLSSAFSKKALMSEIVLAAVSSSTWNNLNQGGNTTVTFHLIKLEQGYVGITAAGKGYLVAAYGTKITVGLLKNRLQLLGQYFSSVFDQIK